MDPPEFTKKDYHHLTALLHNEHYTSQQLMENGLDQEFAYLPVLNLLPIDPTMEPQQYFTTAYYNAILSMSPEVFSLPKGMLMDKRDEKKPVDLGAQDDEHNAATTQQLRTPHNFWLLLHYYRTKYSLSPQYQLQPTASPADPTNNSNTIYRPSHYIQHHNDFLHKQYQQRQQQQRGRGGTPAALLTPQFLDNSLSTVVLPTRESIFPSLSQHFWLQIDNVANTIRGLFTPSDLNAMTAPTVDTIDPDLYIIREGLLPPVCRTKRQYVSVETSPADGTIATTTNNNSLLGAAPTTNTSACQHQDPPKTAAEITQANQALMVQSGQEGYYNFGIISLTQTLHDINYTKNGPADASSEDATPQYLQQLLTPTASTTMSVGQAVMAFVNDKGATNNPGSLTSPSSSSSSTGPDNLINNPHKDFDLFSIPNSTNDNNPAQGVLEAMLLCKYLKQRSATILQCKICDKMFNSPHAFTKHAVVTHHLYTNQTILKSAQVADVIQLHLKKRDAVQKLYQQQQSLLQQQQQLQHQMNTQQGLNKEKHTATMTALTTKMSAIQKQLQALQHTPPLPLADQHRFIDHAIVLSETLSSQYYFSDNLGLSFATQNYTNAQRLLLFAVKNYVQDRARTQAEYTYFTKNNVYALLQREHDLQLSDDRVCDKIDDEWTKAVLLYNANKVLHRQDHPEDEKRQLAATPGDFENDFDQYLSYQKKKMAGGFDHEHMDKIKESYRKRYKLTQLFKGLDGDTVATKKAEKSFDAVMATATQHLEGGLLLPTAQTTMTGGEGVDEELQAWLAKENASQKAKLSPYEAKIQNLIDQQALLQQITKTVVVYPFHDVPDIPQYDPYQYF